MSHVPSFPPRWADWAPGDPTQGEPPLPRFLFNPRPPTVPPWLPLEVRKPLEEQFGSWAVRRAEAVLPRSATVEQVTAAAKELYEAWSKRMPWRPP